MEAKSAMERVCTKKGKTVRVSVEVSRFFQVLRVWPGKMHRHKYRHSTNPGFKKRQEARKI